MIVLHNYSLVNVKIKAVKISLRNNNDPTNKTNLDNNFALKISTKKPTEDGRVTGRKIR